MVANLRAACLFLFSLADYERSYLHKALAHVHDLFYSSQATDFFNQFPRHHVLYFNIIALLHDVLVCFVERAIDPQLRDAVMNQRSIAQSAYSDVTKETLDQQFLQQLRASFRRGNIGEFGVASHAYDVLYGQRTPPSDDRHPGKRPSPFPAEQGGKQAKPPPASDKGFLVWNGSGNPPALDVFYARSGGRSERICVRFIARGLACTRRECRQHHPTAFHNLDAAVKTSLKQEVRKHDGLSFAPGTLPSGTN